MHLLLQVQFFDCCIFKQQQKTTPISAKKISLNPINILIFLGEFGFLSLFQCFYSWSARCLILIVVLFSIRYNVRLVVFFLFCFSRKHFISRIALYTLSGGGGKLQVANFKCCLTIRIQQLSVGASFIIGCKREMFKSNDYCSFGITTFNSFFLVWIFKSLKYKKTK